MKFLKLDFNYRKNFESIPGFKESFERVNQKLSVDRGRIFATVGIPCYLACGTLDVLLFPKIAPFLISIRILFAIVTAISLLFSKTEWWMRNVHAILFLNALWADVGISVMVAHVGGWAHPYFVGNILVATGVTMFMPWSARISFFYCIASIVGHIVINRVYHPFAVEMVIPVGFMLVNAIFSYFSTLGSEISRMKQWAARMEIEKAHQELKGLHQEREHQINEAKHIQQALLPALHQDINGVVIDAIYEPSAELSGDFFGTITTGNSVYVYLADVTGHGLPAAQVTYLVKQIFSNALTKELSVKELFIHVREKYLEHRLPYDLGLQIVRVNVAQNKTEYLRSNAPDPILLNEKKEASLVISSPGSLISALSEGEVKAPVTDVDLQKGSSLYIYSDGAYEFQIKSGSDFGQRRLTLAIAATHSEKWPDGIVERLKRENKDPLFPDDITILRITC